ncbi:hypothetical protein DV735_g5342, partial [Chaetothyriales sp. CBS 134920]
MAAATQTEAKNLSFVLHSLKKVSFEDRPVPSLADHDPHSVLLNVNFTGICGSDVHYWQHGRIGEYVLNGPLVLGHESAGTVVEIGKSVTSLKVGDRVSMEPGYPCRRCARCKEGLYNLCISMTFAATPPHDGTLAKYYVLPEDFCYKLPDNISLEEGAVLEPLAVAVHMVRQSKLKLGDSIVVFGAGPVGVLCCAVARALGATKIIAVDLQKHRLEFAESYVATGSYIPQQESSAQENAQKIRDLFELGLGADVAIDASGAQPSIQTAIHVLRTGGSFVQGGMGKDDVTFPIMAMCTKELKVSGSFRYGAGDYLTGLDLVATGKIDVKKLITRTVRFEEAEQAFEDIRDGKGIKILIQGPQ